MPSLKAYFVPVLLLIHASSSECAKRDAGELVRDLRRDGVDMFIDHVRPVSRAEEYDAADPEDVC